MPNREYLTEVNVPVKPITFYQLIQDAKNTKLKMACTDWKKPRIILLNHFCNFLVYMFQRFYQIDSII